MRHTAFSKMEACLAATPDNWSEVLIHLTDGNWRVRYAAAVALGDLRRPEAVRPLLDLLRDEDAAPLYSQPDVQTSGHAGATAVVPPQFPPGTTEEELEAWRRRGRLKQAACLALGSIAVSTPQVREILQRYATDSGEDYTVRAAASKALASVGDASSVATLRAAEADEEWCTKTEAKKALHAVLARG